MTHTSTKQPSLAAIIRDLRESHARTSPGAWGKGATTHETVSRAEGLEPYKVAEFRHANDAQFCDLAHVFVPRLLSEIEALQSRIAELEAQLSAIGAEPLRKQVVPETLVVPDGYALMPIEPTTGICKAAADGWLDCGSKMVLNKAGAAYRSSVAYFMKKGTQS